MYNTVEEDCKDLCPKDQVIAVKDVRRLLDAVYGRTPGCHLKGAPDQCHPEQCYNPNLGASNATDNPRPRRPPDARCRTRHSRSGRRELPNRFLMSAIARLLVRFRFLAAALLLAAFGFSVATLPKVEFEFSLDPLLQANEDRLEEVYAYYHELPPRFADLIVVLSWDSPLRREEFEQVRRLSREVEALPEVAEVISLADAPVVTRRFRLPIPARFAGLVDDRTLLEIAQQHPLLIGSLISHDGRSSALLVRAASSLGEATDHPLLEALEGFWTEREATGTEAGPEVRYVGGSPIERAMRRAMRDDTAHSLLRELAVMIVLLPLLFRTVRGSLLPLVILSLAVLFNFGVMVALGLNLGLIDVAVPGLVLVIGLADAIHMMHRFEEELAAGRDRREAIVRMMRQVGMACFFTSATTAIGFLSLLAAPHGALRGFALKAALAVTVAFVTVVVATPVLLALWPVRRRPSLPDLGTDARLGSPWMVWAVSLGLTVLAVAGIQRIEVESRWLEELSTEEQAVRDLLWYEQHFAGFLTLDVRIRGALDDPEAFRALEEFERALLREPDVGRCDSYVGWVREILGQDSDPTDRQIQGALQFLRGAGEYFPRHLVHPDFHLGRFLLRTGDVGTTRFGQLQQRVAELAVDLPDNLRADCAGYLAMAHESSSLLITTLLRSFWVSVLAISLLVSLIFRSARIGVLALLPNVLPVLAGLGLAGWLGIELRIGIVMIFCVGLGLAVDDSIHLITRFRQESAAGRLTSDAIRTALRHTGKAMVMTSVILVVGALCFLPSDLQSMRDVGILLSAIVLVALLTDLYLLPLLLRLWPATESSLPGSPTEDSNS